MFLPFICFSFEEILVGGLVLWGVLVMGLCLPVLGCQFSLSLPRPGTIIFTHFSDLHLLAQVRLVDVDFP